MASSTVGSGKDYSTLQAWADARSGSGEPEIATCYSGSDLGALTVDGSVIGECHILVAPGNQHNGTDAGHTGVAYSSGPMTFFSMSIVEVSGLRIENQINLVYGGSTTYGFSVSANLVLVNSPGAFASGILSIQTNNEDAIMTMSGTIFNNIIVDKSADTGSVGIFFVTDLTDPTNNSSAYIWNNSIKVGSTGVFGARAGPETTLLEMKNNIALCGTTAFDVPFDMTFATTDNNLTNLATAYGPNSITSVPTTNVFVSSTDFQIKATSPARNHGVTIPDFSTDAIGVSRPQGAAWDIGALELVGAVVSRLRRAFPFRFFRH